VQSVLLQAGIKPQHMLKFLAHSFIHNLHLNTQPNLPSFLQPAATFSVNIKAVIAEST
jgi:hypothetical protein